MWGGVCGGVWGVGGAKTLAEGEGVSCLKRRGRRERAPPNPGQPQSRPPLPATHTPTWLAPQYVAWKSAPNTRAMLDTSRNARTVDIVAVARCRLIAPTALARYATSSFLFLFGGGRMRVLGVRWGASVSEVLLGAAAAAGDVVAARAVFFLRGASFALSETAAAAAARAGERERDRDAVAGELGGGLATSRV